MSSLLPFGGGERWMCDAAAGLKGRGHDVLLAARPDSALAVKARSNGITVETIEMRGDFDPLAIGALVGVIRRFRPHAVCPNLDREIRISASALGIARVMSRKKNPGSPHRAMLIPRRGSEFPLKDKPLYRLIYQKFVHKVIVNSQATSRTMRSKTPWFPEDKAVVIYNGIDFGVYDRLLERRDEARANLRRSLGLPEDAQLVVLVGELNERKGHRFVIEAAAGVLEACPRARFLFVGEGGGRRDVERLIAGRDLGTAVLVLGFRDDVEEILVASDVLVLPSRVEGFGYVLVEAMGASLPVVASRASSIVEIVEDGITGFLHEVGDSAEIARCLRELLGDARRAREMGARGRALAQEKFNVERMLDEVEAVFFGDPDARTE